MKTVAELSPKQTHRLLLLAKLGVPLQFKGVTDYFVEKPKWYAFPQHDAITWLSDGMKRPNAHEYYLRRAPRNAKSGS